MTGSTTFSAKFLSQFTWWCEIAPIMQIYFVSGNTLDSFLCHGLFFRERERERTNGAMVGSSSISHKVYSEEGGGGGLIRDDCIIIIFFF